MPAPLDIDQLRTLIAIAEIGSFTAAAGLLDKTQAAISIQMRLLEERLGLDIFIRDGRGLRLTEHGQHVLAQARKIVVLSDEALAAFDDATTAGSLSFGIPHDYADQFLPGILAEFSRANPNVEISVTLEPSPRLAERVRAGDLDVAIVTSSHAGNVSVLHREPLLWAGAEGRSFEGDDVLPLALGSGTCPWRIAAIEALAAIGRQYRVVCTSDSAMALTATVLAGLAVTVQPGSSLRGGMRALTDADGFPQLAIACEIGLIRSWQRPATALADRFVRHIGAWFESLHEPRNEGQPANANRSDGHLRLEGEILKRGGDHCICAADLNH